MKFPLKLDHLSAQPSGVDTAELIKKLEDGYRMEKPNNAPNFIRDVMSNCWEKEPKDRPTFRQLEEMITANLELSVSSCYSNLDTPYQKFKVVARNTESFGLEKLLQEKPKRMISFSQSARSGARHTKQSERLRPTRSSVKSLNLL